MLRQGKDWGYTTLIFKSQTVEVHDLEIEKGGFCSEHKHQKINMFYVQTGLLKVRIWRGKKMIDETIVGPGQTTAVYRGFWHDFEGLKDTRCIEIYHVFLESGDIKRRTKGGLKK